MIKAGIKEAGQSGSPELFPITDLEMNRLIQGWNNKIITNGESSRFYFFGYVKYMDNVGTGRQMAFCRKYNPSTKCFTVVNNPEYEYAD